MIGLKCRVAPTCARGTVESPVRECEFTLTATMPSAQGVLVYYV